MKIEKLTENQLADILTESTIISTENFAGMLKNEIKHEKLGKAFTIQANSEAFIITSKTAI